MITKEMQPVSLDPKEYKRRGAVEADALDLVNYDCLITRDGKPVILYMKLPDPEATKHLRWAVQNVKYSETSRISGIKTRSTIFGYNPKHPLRKDFCSATAMAKENPKAHHVITEFAKTLVEMYQEYFPDVFEDHIELTDAKVKREWVIPGTPFTSGIVNKNNALNYHHDAGNFENVLSNMVVLKHQCKGGHLVCPEYGLKFECADNTVVIFDGQQILHGVTPFELLSEDAYRYSVVYYSLKEMWKCDDVNEELMRIRKVRKDREERRARGETYAHQKEKNA